MVVRCAGCTAAYPNVTIGMATEQSISSSLDHYGALAEAFDELAATHPGPKPATRGYHRLIEAVHRSIVRPGAAVLEIGSGNGDLLAAVAPGRGVGVDVSGGMVGLARSRHPELRFDRVAGEDFALDETYDYI